MKFELSEPLSQQQLDVFREGDVAWFTATSLAWNLGDEVVKLGGIFGRKLVLHRRVDEGAGPIWVYKQVARAEYMCFRECRPPLKLSIHVTRRWNDDTFHVECQNGLGQRVFSQIFDEEQKVLHVRVAATAALVEDRLLSTGQKLILHRADDNHNTAVNPATLLSTLTKRRRQ